MTDKATANKIAREDSIAKAMAAYNAAIGALVLVDVLIDASQLTDAYELLLKLDKAVNREYFNMHGAAGWDKVYEWWAARDVRRAEIARRTA